METKNKKVKLEWLALVIGIILTGLLIISIPTFTSFFGVWAMPGAIIPPIIIFSICSYIYDFTLKGENLVKYKKLTNYIKTSFSGLLSLFSLVLFLPVWIPSISLFICSLPFYLIGTISKPWYRILTFPIDIIAKIVPEEKKTKRCYDDKNRNR